ncbi:MAG TPA: hypothetical protein VGP82_14220 [Ktedonobacterales bacterium]|nr:hypothetical protein [Ktedonobacterales bacterium]
MEPNSFLMAYPGTWPNRGLDVIEPLSEVVLYWLFFPTMGNPALRDRDAAASRRDTS